MNAHAYTLPTNPTHPTNTTHPQTQTQTQTRTILVVRVVTLVRRTCRLIDGIALRVSWLTLVPWSSTTQIKIGFLGGRPSDCASYDDGRVFRVSGAGTGTSRSVVGGSRMAKYEGRQIGTIFGWIDSTSTSVHCWYFRIANAHATTPYLYKQTWFRLW